MLAEHLRWLLLGFWIYISRNIRKFRYSRVLNIPFLKYKKSSVMAGLWIYLSRNIKTFRYTRILNISFMKYKKSSVSWKLENFFLRKCKKFFQSRCFWEKILGILGRKVRLVAAYITAAKKNIYSPFQIYILWTSKINSKRYIFILSRAMLTVICILNVFVYNFYTIVLLSVRSRFIKIEIQMHTKYLVNKIKI